MADETPAPETPEKEPEAETPEPETDKPEEQEPAAEPAVEPEPEDEEPPVRKSAKDHIIDRKNRKIEKLQKGDGDDEPEGDDAQKPVRDVVREELNSALEPLKRSLVQSEDEKELQSALTKYPDAKKMEKKIRQYMENDAYAKVPVEFIVRGLLGARDTAKKKADDAAAATRQGGHTRRPTETKPKSAWDLSDKEFEKEVSKIMSGQTQ